MFFVTHRTFISSPASYLEYNTILKVETINTPENVVEGWVIEDTIKLGGGVRFI